MLKKTLAVEVALRTWGSPTAVVTDVSAAQWTIDWPTKGSVEKVIENFRVWVASKLFVSDMYLAFHRYLDCSTKSST